MVNAEELVGSVEIAKRLGVARLQRVHDWRQRDPDFPAPLAVLSRTRIWYWPDVEKWARRTGRLK